MLSTVITINKYPSSQPPTSFIHTYKEHQPESVKSQISLDDCKKLFCYELQKYWLKMSFFHFKIYNFFNFDGKLTIVCVYKSFNHQHSLHVFESLWWATNCGDDYLPSLSVIYLQGLCVDISIIPYQHISLESGSDVTFQIYR